MQRLLVLSPPHRSWISGFADLILAALVSGPIAAPFLAASGLPGLTQISDIIYWMGVHVCPQPELGVSLAPPHIMAVCLRCYGTVLGLLMMRIVFSRDRGQAAFWLDQYGLFGFGIAFALCTAYPLELALQGLENWPIGPLPMTIFGWIAGVGLGAYIMPLFHGHMRK